jgi:hypothetical protein
VRQLHEDLPTEIAVKEQETQGLDADIAERQASIAKDQERGAKLDQKEVLQALAARKLLQQRKFLRRCVVGKAVIHASRSENETLKDQPAGPSRPSLRLHR